MNWAVQVLELIIHILSCSFVIMRFDKRYGMYDKCICPRQNISLNVFFYIIGAVTKVTGYHYSGIDI